MDHLVAFDPGLHDVTKIRILIVDDNELLLEGISEILRSQEGMETVGIARSGKEAVIQALNLQPDVVTMDIRLPDMSGVDATVFIKRHCPRTVVMMLTTFPDDVVVQHSFRAGASAYMMKSQPPGELLDTIRQVYCGQKKVPHGFWEPVDSFTLNKEQIAIIQLLAQDSSMREISLLLNLPLNAIQRHLSPLFDQLKVTSLREIIDYALKSNQLRRPTLAVAGTGKHDPYRYGQQDAQYHGTEGEGVNPLTLREARVLSHIADGDRNQEIAERLCISQETLTAHVKDIMEKLGAKDRIQAIAIAVRRGIVRVV